MIAPCVEKYPSPRKMVAHIRAVIVVIRPRDDGSQNTAAAQVATNQRQPANSARQAPFCPTCRTLVLQTVDEPPDRGFSRPPRMCVPRCSTATMRAATFGGALLGQCHPRGTQKRPAPSARILSVHIVLNDPEDYDGGEDWSSKTITAPNRQAGLRALCALPSTSPASGHTRHPWRTASAIVFLGCGKSIGCADGDQRRDPCSIWINPSKSYQASAGLNDPTAVRLTASYPHLIPANGQRP